MTGPSITTSNGTTVRLEPSEHGQLVILDNVNAPEGFRNYEVGRITDKGYQSAPLSLVGLSPDTLRAVADLIEQVA